MNKLTSTVLLAGIPRQNADLFYAAPFSGSDPIVFLKSGRRRYLVVGGMEAERARRLFHGRLQVFTPADILLNRRPPRALSDWCLGLLRKLRLRAVRVPGNFPVGIVQRLNAAGVRVTVYDKPIFPEREIKSTQELDRIRESQRAAVAAMKTAVGMIRKTEIDNRGRLRDQAGVLTAERLKQAIHVTMLQHDCMGVGTIAACGCAAADPHETGTGPLMAGQGIVLDIFPRHLEHGYWGDLTRTVVKGDPSPELKRMHQAVRRAQRLALANIRAGVVARRIYDLVLKSLTNDGFPTKMNSGVMEGFIHSVGHGLGLEVHEAPGIGLRTNRLRAGQVVTVEPGLYYREIGGVRIEDVVVVTATGCRVLYPCSHFFRL